MKSSHWLLVAALLLAPIAAGAQGAHQCPPPGTPYKIIALSPSSVTTGGTAVTVLPVNGAACGGFIVTANAAGMCVDQVTTAGIVTGTPSTTACVPQNVPFYLVPSALPVSVNSTASGVALGGGGLN